MKILSISPIINNNIKINQQNPQKQSQRTDLPIKVSYGSVYFGKDLVSNKTKKDNKSIKSEYFCLPKNCTPDEFQVNAAKALQNNKNVIVEAPTGTGKTAIAHYVSSKNLEEGKKTFYTTPLKALSNQKLKEFRKVYGEENVGIMTGDTRENPEAPIIIMTTEVYRNLAMNNMYGAKSELTDNLGSVIFDEMHYMDDISRGPVWEESVMFTPKDVQILSLSATIGNAPSIKNWMESVNSKDVELISIPEEKRHVPLVFENIKTDSYLEEEKRIKKLQKNGLNNEEQFSKLARPELSDYKTAVKLFQKKEILPAIIFVFSKNFSNEIVDYLSDEGPDLTTKAEKKEIEKIYESYKNSDYLGSNLNLKALKKGYAIHNAGIMPKQKELTEELFQKKLIKAVVSTETLAAGINMPAKTVLISRPYKPSRRENNSEASSGNIVALTPNEFKQMAGRAGRRGIDDIGYVYTFLVDKNSEEEFEMLKSAPCNPIKSKYNPDYSFLTEYYEYNSDEKLLEDIYKKSFLTYYNNSKDEKTNLDSLLDTSFKRKQVLFDRGFLKQENGKTELTLKGIFSSKIRGYDNLSLTETIAQGSLKEISPAGLASFAAMVASPANNKDIIIAPFGDFSSITSDYTSNISKVYNNLKYSAEQDLSKLGEHYENFADFDEMSNFVNSVKSPDESKNELKYQIKELLIIKEKLKDINAGNANYTPFELKNALLSGKTVSTKTLNAGLEITNTYKKKNNIKNKNNFDSHIEDLENKLKEVSNLADTKSKKSKQRHIKEIKDLNARLDLAYTIKYLDENLLNEIGNNYDFTKKYSLEQAEKNYQNALNKYNIISGKTKLKNEIKGLKSIEEYALANNPETQLKNDKKILNESINSFLNKNIEINETEVNKGLDSELIQYGIDSPNFMYSWAMMNKVNSNSFANWKTLVKKYEQLYDEGTLYRKVMQTSDLLSQIKEIADAGKKYSSNEEEIKYYSDLYNSANEAKQLILKDPVKL